MKIATVLLCHDNVPLVRDTLDAIMTYVGKDVLVVVDEFGWDKFKDEDFPVPVIKGFFHKCSRSPYRNVAFSLEQVSKYYPDADMYCYTEYDCLFINDKFKETLDNLDQNVWCAANDIRCKPNKTYEILNEFLGFSVNTSYTMLGCCVFYRPAFIQALKDINFFERFYEFTKDFQKGFFPSYTDYAFEEYLFPSLAFELGGKVEQLGVWHHNNTWANRVFLMRFRPVIAKIEVSPESSIVHPIKNEGEIRGFFKRKRDRIR